MSHQAEPLISAEDILGRINGGHILDVATGSGGFISFLFDNIEEFIDLTAIDSNIRQLCTARKSYTQSNIHFLCQDARRMAFPDNWFDTVCIANSLHHMTGLPSVLMEMMRVCKPGGHFIVNEMYADNQCVTQLTHVYLHHWWAAVDRIEGIYHRKTFKRHEVVERTGNLGLNKIMCFDLNDLEADPMDPELIQQLDSIIDRYIQRIKVQNAHPELCRRGEELRQRVHEVGFHGATSLLIIGEKA